VDRSVAGDPGFERRALRDIAVDQSLRLIRDRAADHIGVLRIGVAREQLHHRAANRPIFEATQELVRSTNTVSVIASPA
jgi:hypothetical protein